MCMPVKVMGASVRGRSHEINGKPCQDAWDRIHLADGTEILALGDGHGGDDYIHSDVGARIAVQTFCKMVANYIMITGKDGFCTYMKDEGEFKFAKKLESEWKYRVLEHHRLKHPDDKELSEEMILRQYGTTLLGLVITDIETVMFQLGDGNVMVIGDSFGNMITRSEMVYGTETHSLCEEDAWRWAECKVQRKADGRHMYWLSSDGFVNSYRSDEEALETCTCYFDRVKASFRDVSRYMKAWLHETSYYGSGDDITVVLAYDSAEEPHEYL